ncbi:hypothetical protein TNCV_4297761 [Trichonephila clavipes]|nr:hypothetical protein TNCV_4297761 [Trichonephila clavipes]
MSSLLVCKTTLTNSFSDWTVHPTPQWSANVVDYLDGHFPRAYRFDESRTTMCYLPKSRAEVLTYQLKEGSEAIDNNSTIQRGDRQPLARGAIISVNLLYNFVDF